MGLHNFQISERREARGGDPVSPNARGAAKNQEEKEWQANDPIPQTGEGNIAEGSGRIERCRFSRQV
jgi:hypothetical protein